MRSRLNGSYHAYISSYGFYFRRNNWSINCWRFPSLGQRHITIHIEGKQTARKVMKLWQIREKFATIKQVVSATFKNLFNAEWMTNFVEDKTPFLKEGSGWVYKYKGKLYPYVDAEEMENRDAI